MGFALPENYKPVHFFASKLGKTQIEATGSITPNLTLRQPESKAECKARRERNWDLSRPKKKAKLRKG